MAEIFSQAQLEVLGYHDFFAEGKNPSECAVAANASSSDESRRFTNTFSFQDLTGKSIIEFITYAKFKVEINGLIETPIILMLLKNRNFQKI